MSANPTQLGWATTPLPVRQCRLCLHRSTDVQVGPIRWRDPLPGATFDAGPRCRDHVTCRERVEAFGDAWPVEDGTASTAAAPHPPAEHEPPAPSPGEVALLPPSPGDTPELDFG